MDSSCNAGLSRSKLGKLSVKSSSGGNGRPGILPPLGVDFETALGALLRTPPPPKRDAADKPKVRKRKAGMEKAAPSKRKRP